MSLKINNKLARRFWLKSQGLSDNPTGPIDVLHIIKRLGFVQLDTLRNVSRAHHHIIWSRNQNYGENMLGRLLAKDRTIFEHFTHDASVLPMEYYPMWKRQFKRLGEKVSRSDFYKTALDAGEIAKIKDRIRQEGPLSTHAFDTKITGKKEMWARPPHKKALDLMWYGGELTTSHRENFTKFYDLSERVIPREYFDSNITDGDQVDWLCRNALDRLGFGTPGDIQRFWAAVSAKEARAWVEDVADLVPVDIESADGEWTKSYAHSDIEARLENVKEPTSRLRILNPFDPAVRDRKRLSRLFGFEYTIEIFVPPAKRKWGYYVYPILEGDRFIGRIDMKADRAAGQLKIIQIWAEPGIKWTTNRSTKLSAELSRLKRLIDAKDVQWICDKI